VAYGALAAIGPDASERDQDALMRAFASLVVPDGDRPFVAPGTTASPTPEVVRSK
jgi:hypothetical protein